MIKKISLLCMTVILLLCACTAAPEEASPIEYSFTTQTVLYAEENGQYSFRRDMDYLETNLAHFYFEAQIDDEQRYSCIEVTERIIQSQSSLDVIPEIYVFTEDTYSTANVIGNALYISQQDWYSVDYVTMVLLAAYGECSHYGLTYGYAIMLCAQFEWIEKVETQFIQPDVVAINDLNFLCFNPRFTSEADIIVAQQNACDFAKYYLSANNEAAMQKLIANSDTSAGMAALSNELSQYYEVNGLTYTPTEIRYGHGGISFDYIIKSDLATFYMGTEWVDENQDINPLVTENYLHESYPTVSEFFEINLQQMRQYQELFALDYYDNDLNIIFFNSSLSPYSFYQSGTHRIYVLNIDSLMHEYIHALTQPDASMDLWEVEGFARYFSYKYDYYGIAFLNYDYNNTPETAATQYVHEYLAAIERPIDMSIDFSEVENIAVYSRGYKNPDASYVAGSSFIQYLVDQYGEKLVIQYIYGDRSPLPRSHSELVADWNTYIEENYQNYSIYSGK